MAVPDPLITVAPDRLGGEPVFAGTRVPVRALFDYLEAGDSLGEFLEDFPSVPREHALAVLKASKAAVVLQAVGRDPYVASADELAAIDEALEQFQRGQRASDADVAAAFARFRE